MNTENDTKIECSCYYKNNDCLESAAGCSTLLKKLIMREHTKTIKSIPVKSYNDSGFEDKIF